jgi:uncharacterized protein (DUF1499 family)
MKTALCFLLLAIVAAAVVDGFGIFDQIKNVGQPAKAAAAGSGKAILSCPPGSKNCIVTTWTIPKGKGGNVKASVLKILNSYPQAGQANVDKGGYKIVSSNSPIKVEYTSGIGTFAKLFNGGQPFIDDLIAVIGSDSVTIKSSSRIGQSDLGVNQKRLKFLGGKAKALGWEVPEPKY